MPIRTKEQALADLLGELFPIPGDFVPFLLSLPGGKNLLSLLDMNSSSTAITQDVVDQMRTRGLVDADLFERLQEQAPKNPRVNEVRNQWLIDIDTWSSTPSQVTRSAKSAKAPTVFVSYARRDRSFYEELVTHLSILERKGVIDLWQEGRLLAGSEWEKINYSKIYEADIFILLVSPDLISSKYFWETEFQHTQNVGTSKGGRIVPVLVRPCDLSAIPLLANFQLFPPDGTAISEADDPDAIWVQLSGVIRELANNWRASV